jgi:hypothetical protein
MTNQPPPDPNRRRQTGEIPPVERVRPAQQRPPSSTAPRRGKARQRRDGGLYLPLWSIILMLFAVCGATLGIVALVLSLGGKSTEGTVNAQGTVIPPTQPEPVLIVNSPVPTDRPADFPDSPATATIPPQFDPNLVQGLFQAPPDFRLEGPVLPTLVLTPTPVALTIGATVIVADVGDQELNVRDMAGIFGTNIVFRAPNGQRFTIIGGPEQQDNLTWWQIQDPTNPARSGWASAQYLQAIPAGQP